MSDPFSLLNKLKRDHQPIYADLADEILKYVSPFELVTSKDAGRIIFKTWLRKQEFEAVVGTHKSQIFGLVMKEVLQSKGWTGVKNSAPGRRDTVYTRSAPRLIRTKPQHDFSALLEPGNS